MTTTDAEAIARLPTDAAARRLPEFIKTLRINRAARQESVYASDNVYALLDALDAAESRVRESEAENKRLAERLDLLAVGFGVPDGGQYIADWQTKIDKLKAAERAPAEVYERAAKEAETCWVAYTGRAGDDEREQIDRARQDIAAAIRKLTRAS